MFRNVLGIRSDIYDNIAVYITTALKTRQRGNNGLFVIIVPKVLQQRFLFRWLNNFGDFWVNFDWYIH